LEFGDNVAGREAGTTLVPVAYGPGFVAPSALGTQTQARLLDELIRVHP
jgi:hypothetical protein